MPPGKTAGVAQVTAQWRIAIKCGGKISGTAEPFWAPWSVTIGDVAKLAGVSASTVSRVINKSAPISEKTTGRIYRAMEELKYVPNDIARSFASGSARAIAIAVNASDTRSYANRFFNNTVFGIETAAHRRGYNFIITSANDGRGGVGSLEKLILSKKIDGLVLPVSLLRSSIVKIVEDMSFPFVVLGRVKHAGGRLSWVDIANEQAGANAVRYFLGKGYRRIGFLTRGDKELFTRDRLDGYRAELSRSGLSPNADGGSVFTVFFRIILPLASPAIASVSIFNFLTAWEEFTWAMTVINDNAKRTLPIAISGFFGQHQFTQWGYVFAMSVASLMPVLIVFILCQKYFVSGLQAGGLKG